MEHSPALSHSRAVRCNAVALRPRWTTLWISVPFGRDRGHERVVADHPTGVGHRDRPLPGDLTHLTGGDLAPVEGGGVDPDDDLGERPILVPARHRCPRSALAGGSVGQRDQGVSGVGVVVLPQPGLCGPVRTPLAFFASTVAMNRVNSAGGRQNAPWPPSSSDPGPEEPAPTDPLGPLPLGLARRGPHHPGRLVLQLLGRPRRRGSQQTLPRLAGLRSRPDRWPWPDASTPPPPSTPSRVSGAVSTASAVSSNFTASPTPIPVTCANQCAAERCPPRRRHRSVPATRPRGQRHPRRGQMLDPGEHLHQIHRVTRPHQLRIEPIHQRGDDIDRRRGVTPRLPHRRSEPLRTHARNATQGV